MTSTELAKFVRQIELKTRGLSSQVFSGEYHAAFKGRGMSFSEVRTYQPGDDVRDIDWNVTARSGEPHIKIFEEERELSVVLMVDLTSSMLFGTRGQTKRRLATELAAVIGSSALNNNDKVGAVLYGTGEPFYVPPKKGFQHILRIVRELGITAAQTGEAKFAEALQFVTNVTRRRAIVFVIGDFLQQGEYTVPLRVAARRHDLIGLQLVDPFERELPDVGLLPVKDLETGKSSICDTSNTKTRARHQAFYEGERGQAVQQFRTAGAQMLDLTTGQDYIPVLINFFKSRHKRRGR